MSFSYSDSDSKENAEPEDDVDFNQRPSYACFDDSAYKTPELTDSIVRTLDKEFLLMEEQQSEKIRTYLRIRPSSKNSDMYQQEGSSVLKIIGHKSLKKINAYADETKFTFSRVLGPDCSQITVFEECVKPLLESFLRGESCLIFSYGATNSGKTFTMQGHGKHFGIVPRTFEYIFNELQDKLYTTGNIKPNLFSACQELSDTDTKALEVTKQKILNETKINKGFNAEMNSFRASFSQRSYRTSSSSDGTAAVLVDNTSNQQTPYNQFPPNTDLCAVWISFAEIYNERVYDLFEAIPRGKIRKEMKLLQDKQGRVYIKDLTEVCANNAEDAYQLFLAGKKNLQFAATQANLHSSRSHSFFNIRIVSLGVSQNVAYPKKVFQISFCDLAGTERVSQTGNAGVRLKESGNINQSLFVLLKCIRAMRVKQAKNSTDILPFRESKLARLFQGYLTSATHTCMIVNINPDPEMFDSTFQVLQNSAVASEVITYRTVEPPVNNSNFYKRVRNSIGFSNHLKDQLNSTAFSDSFVSDDGDDEEDDFCAPTVVAKSKIIGESLKDRNLKLEAEIEVLKRLLMTAEERIRKEVVDQFAQIQSEYDEEQKILTLEKEKFNNNIQKRQMSMAAKIWKGTIGDAERVKSPAPNSLELVTPENKGFSTQDKLARLTQENEELRSKNEDWQNSCLALQDSLNDRNSLIAQYLAEKSEIAYLHNSQLTDLQHLLELKDEEIANLKQGDPIKFKNESMIQINHLSEELKVKQSRLAEAEGELGDALKTCLEYHEKLNEANSQITKMSIDYNKLHEENRNLTEENEVLHLSIDDLNATLAKERKKALESENKSRTRSRRNLQ